MVEIFDGLQTWGGQDEENAWRLSFLFPGCLLILTAALVSYYGTDTPRGDVSERIEKGEKPTEAIASLSDAACNPMTWVLALQYAISFGVELVVYNMAASYFHEEFHTPVLQAGKVAAYAGVTNLFARAMGGWLSDMANTRWGIKGRMWVQFTLLIFESFFLLWFAYAASYKEAIVLLLVFSIFVQAANGSCFALVPYLSNQSGGSVAGIVGSGGNVGSVIFTLVFIYGQFEKRATGFAVMGGSVLAASLSLWLIDPEQLEQGHRLVDSSMHSIKSEGEGEQEGQGKGMEAVVIH
jgi:NNP family nitrate/nitrite transporter-like MFS transporter